MFKTQEEALYLRCEGHGKKRSKEICSFPSKHPIQTDEAELVVDDISTEWHAIDNDGSTLICKINFNANASIQEAHLHSPHAMRVELEIGGRSLHFILTDVERNRRTIVEPKSAIKVNEGFFQNTPREVHILRQSV